MKISDHPPTIETREAIQPFRSEKHRPLALRTRAYGFTLLEILVATAIMGTAVAALFGSAGETGMN